MSWTRVDVFNGCVVPEVDDQGSTAGTEHPMHLVERRAGRTKVLEGRATEQKIERIGFEGHPRRVAFEKIDRHASPSGVVASDSHKVVLRSSPLIR